jgi:thymidylate synthase
MHIVSSEYVDQALVRGLRGLTDYGSWQTSRAGEVLVAPWPVITVNRRPMNRVSFSPLRDANPFFHLMEALWMLEGRNDATWLDQFVGDFSSRFAEADGHSHGAYGFRWRAHFELEGGGGWPDQLEKAIKLLKVNPEDRRVVIAMWDPVADLGADKRDIPCNTHIYLRVRTEHHKVGSGGVEPLMVDQDERLLDLSVSCRSNDAVWGAHGANAVHFSVLQEYLAARIGVGIGAFYQFSNNYHVYRPIYEKLWPKINQQEGTADSFNWYATGSPTPIVTVPDDFDTDLSVFFEKDWEYCSYNNSFFGQVAAPLRQSYVSWRAGNFELACRQIFEAPVCDWTVAAQEWYNRRLHKRLAR